MVEGLVLPAPIETATRSISGSVLPFVGNPRGGRTAAILASITSTCRRHEIDPQLYFTHGKDSCWIVTLVS